MRRLGAPAADERDRAAGPRRQDGRARGSDRHLDRPARRLLPGRLRRSRPRHRGVDTPPHRRVRDGRDPPRRDAGPRAASDERREGVRRLVERTMRESHGRAVAVLVGQLRGLRSRRGSGPGCLVDALRTWGCDGPPDERLRLGSARARGAVGGSVTMAAQAARWTSSLSSAMFQPVAPGESAGMPAWVITIRVLPSSSVSSTVTSVISG